MIRRPPGSTLTVTLFPLTPLYRSGLNGHAVIVGNNGTLPDWRRIAEAAKKTPGVTSALPLIETPLMGTANGRFEGVLVRGMRVEDIRSNKKIGRAHV